MISGVVHHLPGNRYLVRQYQVNLLDENNIPKVNYLSKSICYKCKKIMNCEIKYNDARSIIQISRKKELTYEINYLTKSHGICDDCNDGTL